MFAELSYFEVKVEYSQTDCRYYCVLAASSDEATRIIYDYLGKSVNISRIYANNHRAMKAVNF